MEQIIKITESGGNKFASAKDLYLALGLDKANWSRWSSENIVKNHLFIENTDWFLHYDVNPSGGRPTQDFIISIDFAKRLAMMARSEKGEVARTYFIECERRAANPVANMSRLDMARMLLQAEEENARILADNRILEISNENKAVTIELQEKALQEAAPKVHYCDQVLQSTSTITTTVIAKELGFTSAIAFNKKLCELGIQYRTGGDTWVLYSKYQGQDWTRTRTYSYTDSEGRSRTNITTVWTEKGRQFLHLLLKNFPQP